MCLCAAPAGLEGCIAWLESGTSTQPATITAMQVEMMAGCVLVLGSSSCSPFVTSLSCGCNLVATWKAHPWEGAHPWSGWTQLEEKRVDVVGRSGVDRGRQWTTVDRVDRSTGVDSRQQVDSRQRSTGVDSGHTLFLSTFGRQWSTVVDSGST